MTVILLSRRYCVKTAERKITQTTPHDSPRRLQFSDAKAVSYTHLTLPTILRV